ncbi:MAG: formate dehydrogenase subunit gamma [Pseudomonadota bacterium]|nr:formate dehydrogenase subunit gamma [Pseudomonadota bacterium]
MHATILNAVFAAGLLAFGGHVLAQQDASTGAGRTPAPATTVRTAPLDIPNPPGSAGASASSKAPAPEPQPGDSNAQRARSQPGNNAPFWRGVHDSGRAPGSVNNLRAGERGELVQPITQYPGTRVTNAGEAWRQIRNWWIIPYGGALVVIAVLALALFYWAKGPITNHSPDTGRVIQRFTYFERAAHWTNAIAFCILAISGLTMAFGKFLILPLTGGLLFGWLTYALKTAHNLVGPLFAVSMVIIVMTFVHSNWPSLADLKWLLKGGGMFGGEEPASHRFNAGEKIVFWFGVLLLGGIVIASGFALDKVVPGLALTRPDMQLAHIVHAISAVLIIVVFLGHIYMGTVGMRGSYRAMKTGYVDETWAREHHRLWYDDIAAGKIPVQRDPPARPLRQPAT